MQFVHRLHLHKRNGTVLKQRWSKLRSSYTITCEKYNKSVQGDSDSAGREVEYLRWVGSMREKKKETRCRISIVETDNSRRTLRFDAVKRREAAAKVAAERMMAVG